MIFWGVHRRDIDLKYITFPALFYFMTIEYCWLWTNVFLLFWAKLPDTRYLVSFIIYPSSIYVY